MYVSLIHWVGRGTGTPTDKDTEVSASWLEVREERRAAKVEEWRILHCIDSFFSSSIFLKKIIEKKKNLVRQELANASSNASKSEKGEGNKGNKEEENKPN